MTDIEKKFAGLIVGALALGWVVSTFKIDLPTLLGVVEGEPEVPPEEEDDKAFPEEEVETQLEACTRLGGVWTPGIGCTFTGTGGTTPGTPPTETPPTDEFDPLFPEEEPSGIPTQGLVIGRFTDPMGRITSFGIIEPKFQASFLAGGPGRTLEPV